MCVRFDPALQLKIDAYRLEAFEGQYSVACYAVQHPVRQQTRRTLTVQRHKIGKCLAFS